MLITIVNVMCIKILINMSRICKREMFTLFLWSVQWILLLLTIKTLTHEDPKSPDVYHKHANKHTLQKRS